MATDPKHSPLQGFFIEVGCPGCGGALEIDSDFFVTKCSHCGTPLRLLLPDTPPAYLLPNKLSRQEARFKIDRQLKSLGLPLTGQALVYKNLYYPYWKIDAMLLRCRNRKERMAVPIDDSAGEEIIDYKKTSQVSLTPYHTTVAASTRLDGVPDSIGVRGQSLKVIPFASSKIEEGFDTLEVRRSAEEVVTTIELSVSRMSTIELAEFGENLTKIFNPVASLIFFPICIAEDYAGVGHRRYVLDGLSGRILSACDSEQGINNPENEEARPIKMFNLYHQPDEEFNDEQSLLFADLDLPEAGIRFDNLEGEVDKNAAPVEFGAVQVCFHRCHVCGADLPARQSCIYICHNCHELTSLDKHLPVKPDVLVTETSEKNVQFFPFWSYRTSPGKLFGSLKELNRVMVPAFKIPNFEALYRLTCRVSTASTKLDFAPVECLDERFAPVDVWPSLGIILASVANSRYALEKTKRLPAQELPLSREDVVLCFIPFKLENYFYVDSVLNSVTFEKTLAAV